MNKKMLKILTLLAVTFQLGGTAFAQRPVPSVGMAKSIQRNVLREELKKCLLDHEYIQMKAAVQYILQSSPALLSYLKKIESQRCPKVIEKARAFGMTDKEIDEAIKQRYIKPQSDFNPPKLFEQKTVNDEGGAHTG